VHAPTEAALRLRLQDGFDPALVEKIEISVPQNAIGMCDIAEPKSGLEAKFSLAHNVALGLLDKADGSLALYQDETFEVDGVADLRKKAVVRGNPDFQSFYAELQVTQSNGKVIKQEFDIGAPMRDLSEQEAKLAKKFRALATPILGEAQTESMFAAIAGLENQAGVSDWLSAARVA
jgi:2-methylcitrate dehydratase PrpD